MNTLVALLRFGLFGADIPSGLPSDDKGWQAMFDLSHQQAVTALLYDAILKLPQESRPKRRVLFHFTSMTQTIEQDNRQREKALQHYASIVHTHLSLPTVVVKGSSLSCLYPNPLHRECGDNDLYTGPHTEAVAKLFEKGGLTIDRKDPRHISFSLDSVTFECHSYLLYHNDDIEWNKEPLAAKCDTPQPSFFVHRFAIGTATGSPFSPLREGTATQDIANHYSDMTAAASSPLGEGCPQRGWGVSTHLFTLQREQSAFFLAKHTEHHSVFFHKAIPLRSLIDWSLLLGSDGFDHKSFADLKRGTDVDIFADLMSLYCNSLFGLHLPCNEERLVAKGLVPDDFERIYMYQPERARLAVVRVVRRSWKYLRYRRQYRAIYGQSMFRRFYFHNVGVALKNKL